VKGIVGQRKRGRRFSKNAPKTVRNKLKTVRQLIKWAIKPRILAEDPSSAFILPPEPDHEAVCWEREEVQRILDCSEQPLRDLFEFFLMTGLRSGELCWLMKDDVHLRRKALHPRPGKNLPVHRPSLDAQARPRADRVPLVPEAAAIAERAMRTSPGPWVFWSARSRPPRRGQYGSGPLLAALHKAKPRAGIERGTVHTFRHVFCAFAANRRISPVMKILGHGSLKIILRYYHLELDELFDCVHDLPFSEFLNAPNH
jgi:integrase